MNELKTDIILQIGAAIHRCGRFLIAAHVRPDGDAIGSLLGMTTILRNLGKKADAFCLDSFPAGFEFLKGAETVLRSVPDPRSYDAAILVDCGDLSRVGDEPAKSIGLIPFLICIDHHLANAPFGNIHWLETSASSACEMLFDLCEGLGYELDPDIAAQLYTGIMTDTGSFRFSNTNRRTLEVASRLVASGAQPALIARQVYDSASPQRIFLMARVLSTVAFFAQERLVTAEMSLRMLAETAASPADSEGFINELRSVEPVKLAMLFREAADGIVHVSMRSKGDVDVSLFARKYGGGGHYHAAACHMPGNLAAVRSALTDEALSYIA